jgi:hypothetical protein
MEDSGQDAPVGFDVFDGSLRTSSLFGQVILSLTLAFPELPDTFPVCTKAIFWHLATPLRIRCEPDATKKPLQAASTMYGCNVRLVDSTNNEGWQRGNNRWQRRNNPGPNSEKGVIQCAIKVPPVGWIGTWLPC